PKYLYALSSILGSAGESAGVDKMLRIRIKTILHIPQSFPNTHMYLAAKDGGLGTMNIERVGQEVQLKALARLARLGNRVVDHLLNETIGAYHCRLASQLRSRSDWWREHPSLYANRDLFAHHGEALGNTWLQPDTYHLKDGDRIKAL
ncbi:unnamed protein product, partial [Ixodes hexagonus]